MAAPDETELPGMTDSNSVLTLALECCRFQAVFRWHGQIAQLSGRVQLCQFSPHHQLDPLRQLNGLEQRNGFSGKQQFGATRSECLDHDPLSVRPVNALVIPLDGRRCHATESFARTPFAPTAAWRSANSGKNCVVSLPEIRRLTILHDVL